MLKTLYVHPTKLSLMKISIYYLLVFFSLGFALGVWLAARKSLPALGRVAACFAASKVKKLYRAKQNSTEPKKAQLALQSSDQQLDLILRNIPQSVLVLNTVGNIKWLNPHAYELHQLSEGNKTPSTLDEYAALFEYKAADGRLLSREEYPASQALKGKLVSGSILYVTRRDTGKKWIGLYSAIPIRNSEGQVIQVILTIDDITERKKHEDKLLLLGEITENAAEGLILVNALNGLIQYTNRKLNETFGYAPGELEGQIFSVLNAPSDTPPVEETAAIIRSLDEHGTWNGEQLSLRKNGTVLWSNIIISTFLHPEHGLLWIVHQTDISARKHAEEQLRISAKVFDSSTEAILVTDALASIVSVNPAFTEITGYSFAEVEGKNPSVLSSGLHNAQFYEEMWRSLDRQGYWQGEIWDRKKNGVIYPGWLSITLLKNSKGEVSNYVAFFSDISESKAAQQKIEFLSYNDILTGLPNRFFAKDRVNQAITYAQRTLSKFAVLVIGMDNFKAINESLGHLVGDRLLVDVALRLREAMRDADMVSRLVGDEFLVLLGENCESDSIFQTAERILEIIAPPFKTNNQEISTSVSIGIAVFPTDGDEFDTLLKNADSAMYLAKEAGRNTYRFFDESINTNAFEYVYLRNGLRRALERGDFILHYQPQIELCSGKLIGAEALLLWYDPELGLIQPDRFITIAEESGLIVPIGEWVLQEACRQAVAWQQAGLAKFVVAVNLSAVQFKRGDLAKTVKKTLDQSGLEPGYLELEFTESILIRETEITLATVRQLKMLGVRLAIDDFGTGYSSLSYLKRFNVNKVKIDKSFVRDVSTNAGDAAIVQAIIQIAKSLSFKTIAEGIETEIVAEKLKALGCDEGQGFLFSRPLPSEQFAVFLQHFHHTAFSTSERE